MSTWWLGKLGGLDSSSLSSRDQSVLRKCFRVPKLYILFPIVPVCLLLDESFWMEGSLLALEGGVLCNYLNQVTTGASGLWAGCLM